MEEEEELELVEGEREKAENCEGEEEAVEGKTARWTGNWEKGSRIIVEYDYLNKLQFREN